MASILAGEENKERTLGYRATITPRDRSRFPFVVVCTFSAEVNTILRDGETGHNHLART